MLYIFHVDTGRMLTFDMNLALETVQCLKETIERLHNLPVSNQVLLISGGEILQPNSRVCSYSSGTDTNPIYMFITSFAETKNPPQPWPSIEQDPDFEKLVRQSLALPATYNTVVSRAQLAQQFFESARDEIKICDKLVYEQHLQHQGWAAVIANLEDLTTEFRQRYDDFCRCFDDFLEKKSAYLKLLGCFDDDLDQLAKVPILPGLISSAQQEFHGFDEYLDENESFTLSAATQNENNQRLNLKQFLQTEYEEMENSGNQKPKGLTLLQWISAKETHKSFENVASNCFKQLQSFENEKIYNLRTQIQKAMENAEMEDMREIKGLKDRLQGLDKLMVEVKNKVQDQSELAIAFQQNQNRASNLGDASILPDLCETHSSQLHVMHKNHMELRDIRRRISKAKEELGLNVMQRLKFIGHVENRMSELDNQMLFSHRCLRRLQRHLVIIEQLHFAPVMYVTAVTEVVRRRTFSTLFLRWASDLAYQLQTIHDEEVMRRREFELLFDGHFLNSLFTGMEDIPPAYAVQAPPIFDSSLPNLTKEDLEVLSLCLPDVSSKIALPDLSTVIEFFLLRGTCANKSDAKSSVSEDKAEINPLRLVDTRSHLKDEFESETDTEEFEKVGQSPMERRQLSLLINDSTLKSQIKSLNSRSIPHKCETKCATTSTDAISTQNIETLTEVRKNSISIDGVLIKKPLSYFSLPYNSPLISSSAIPKKPSRLHKLTQSKSSTDILPSIPEQHSPLSKRKTKPVYQSSESSSDDNSMGHRLIPIVDIVYPYMDKDILGKCEPECEFINSEFYIDESLPSSLNSDRQDEQFLRQLKDESSSDDIQQIMDEQYSSENCDIGKLLNDSEAVISLLEENLCSSRLEIDRLKNLLATMFQLSQTSVSLLREQLNDIKNCSETNRSLIEVQLVKVSEVWNQIKAEMKIHEREMINRLTVDHELELNDIKKYLSAKSDEVEMLKNEKNDIAASIVTMQSEQDKELHRLQQTEIELKSKLAALEAELENVNADKQKSLHELTVNLTREHKTEIEALRCRFKLMTNMERSPSDTSLEKIERLDVIDLISHDSILMQTREDLEYEREIAVKEAVEKERIKWEKLTNSPQKSPVMSRDLYKQILDEKERQLDVFREREQLLLKENSQHKELIQKLTDVEVSDAFVLKNQIERLQDDKCKLEEELGMEKSRRIEMESSLAGDKSLLSTSTKTMSSSSRSKTHSKGRVTLEGCSEGDIVVIVWNPDHGQYVIVQEASILYFLHELSHKGLNLTYPTGDSFRPSKFHCIGRIVTKEYCHAKKDDNRYKVSKGTKFYRIKAVPVTPTKHIDSSKMSSKRDKHESDRPHCSKTTSNQLLIDSFAQTDSSTTIGEKDMVDFGAMVQQKSHYKERNISITEEDEAAIVPQSNYQYLCVSEEDESAENIQLNEATTVTSHLPADQGLSDKDQDMQDDSDEYRSLESRDEQENTLSS